MKSNSEFSKSLPYSLIRRLSHNFIPGTISKRFLKNDHRSLSHTKDKVTDLTLAKRFQESPSSVFHDLMTSWPLITRTVTPALTAPDQLFFHSRMK